MTMPELKPPNTTAINVQRLTDTQAEKLYNACLRILDEVGVRLYSNEAVALMKEAGATVSDGNLVRIPRTLVEWARGVAPKTITLYNRAGEPVMPINGRRSFFGTGSDCLFVLDHRTGQRRKPVLRDVEEAMILLDALPHYDFAMCMFLPYDVPTATADRYQMAAMLQYTSKPIMYVTTDFEGAVDAVKMAEAVRGSAEALREKPLAACYINVTTGLIHNEEALQKLLYLSEKGLPFAYVPSTQGGATAPVTPAAAMVISQAGALAGLVLSQLKREGAPIIMPGWGGNMLDMRTTVQPYADPDKRMMTLDFVHYLGLPMFALAGASDSKTLDQQAGIEAALTLMGDVMAGAHIVHDLGYLESGLLGSLPQMAICDEILGWLSHFVAPIDVSDEALALDLIAETGPEGHYIDSEHTFEHFRERWYPTLFDRQNHEGWAESGSLTLGERATAYVTQVLAEHQPEPLPDEVWARVVAIRDAAAEQETA